MLSLDDQIPDLHIKIHGQAARKRLMVSIIDRALTVRLRIQDVIETGCYSLLHHEDLPHYSRRGAGCAALIKRIGLRGIPISWPEHAPRPDMMQTAQTQVAKTRTDGGPSLDPLERSDTRPKGLP